MQNFSLMSDECLSILDVEDIPGVRLQRLLRHVNLLVSSLSCRSSYIPNWPGVRVCV